MSNIRGFSAESNIPALIRQWGSDRNLLKGATPQRQMFKLASEFGELADGIAKGDALAIKDGIGDTFVVLCIIAGQCDVDLESGDWSRKLVAYSDDEIELTFARVLDRISHLGVVLWSDSLTYTPLAVRDAIHRLCDLADLLGLSLEECAAHAYDEIKDRKGVMYNGTFVKSTDERYVAIMAELHPDEEGVA